MDRPDERGKPDEPGKPTPEPVPQDGGHGNPPPKPPGQN